MEPKRGGKFAFAFKAVGSDGRTVTDRVQANSEQEALAELARLGYRNAQLLDMQTSAIKLDDARSSLRLNFTAKEEMELRRQRNLADRLAWLFAKNVTIWGPLVGWLVLTIWQDGASTRQALWPCLGLIAFLLWFSWANVPGVLYNRALEASAWCRWSEVWRLMEWLARWKRWFNTPFPQHELLFRSATALAGLDRLGDALEMVAPLKQDASLRPGFFTMRCASIYAAARDYEGMAMCQREAHQVAPSPSNSVDLATTLARRLRNSAEAASLLDGVDVAQLAPLLQLFAYYARGVIAVNEGNPKAGLDWLQQSLEIAKTNVGTPLITSIILDARAFCALALAALGDRQAALAEYAAARPMLKARRDRELIARCEAAIGKRSTQK
jgi:tetratricopeptide (TPR) repeat protein